MKIALIQINTTVGDFKRNVDKAVLAAGRARDAGADLAVLSELCVPGYPPRDLLERPAFIDANLHLLAQMDMRQLSSAGIGP